MQWLSLYLYHERGPLTKRDPPTHHNHTETLQAMAFDTKVRLSILIQTLTYSHRDCFVADVWRRPELPTPTHRSRTHCVGRDRGTTRADTGWQRWRVYRGAGWGMVTSCTPSPAEDVRQITRILFVFSLGEVDELENWRKGKQYIICWLHILQLGHRM